MALQSHAHRCGRLALAVSERQAPTGWTALFFAPPQRTGKHPVPQAEP